MGHWIGKARLVVKGYTQTYGIDHEKIFSSTAKMNTIQVVPALTTHSEWDLY